MIVVCQSGTQRNQKPRGSIDVALSLSLSSASVTEGGWFVVGCSKVFALAVRCCCGCSSQKQQLRNAKKTHARTHSHTLSLSLLNSLELS
jgi:hypothetical protein